MRGNHDDSPTGKMHRYRSPSARAPLRPCGGVHPWRGDAGDRGRAARRGRDDHPRGPHVRRGGPTPAADHQRQFPRGTRHRDRGTRAPLGTPLRGNGPMGVPGPLGVRAGAGQEVQDEPVDGLRADTVPPGPGAGLLCDPERSGSRAGALPPRDPSRSWPGSRGSNGCSTAPDPSRSAIRSCSPRALISVRSVRTIQAGSGPSMPGFARPASSREFGHELATPWCSVPAPSSPWPHRGHRVR